MLSHYDDDKPQNTEKVPFKACFHRLSVATKVVLSDEKSNLSR